MQGQVSLIKNVPASITPKALNRLLDTITQDQGGNWRVTSISGNNNGAMKVRLTKKVKISI